MWKIIVAGLVGFGVGVITCKLVIESGMEDMLNEEIEKYKEEFEQRHPIPVQEPVDFVEIVTETEMVVQAATALSTYRNEPGPGHVDYTAYSGGSGWQNTPAVKVQITPPENDDNSPIVIMMEEYGDNDFGHEQHNLKYYPECDTLTNERDDVIAPEARAEMVGDCLSVFKDAGPGEGILYIRAPKLNMEFEVWREAGTYIEVVGGG